MREELKQADRPLYRRTARLNGLDLLLLTILLLAGLWLYQRIEIGVHYQWRWAQAFSLMLTSSANGELPFFFQGMIATLRLSLFAMVIAGIIGLTLALAQRSKLFWLRWPARAYVQLIRNIPALVFVFIFYFFLSSQLFPALGITQLLRDNTEDPSGILRLLFGPQQLWENLLSGIVCIGLIAAAYVAEVIRAGLASVPIGQHEASQSLGLSGWNRYCYIILPQVLRNILPALAGQFISLVKDSSIISLISIQELTFVGSEMANSSGMIFEIWLMVGLSYLVLCWCLSLLFAGLEKRTRSTP